MLLGTAAEIRMLWLGPGEDKSYKYKIPKSETLIPEAVINVSCVHKNSGIIVSHLI